MPTQKCVPLCVNVYVCVLMLACVFWSTCVYVCVGLCAECLCMPMHLNAHVAQCVSKHLYRNSMPMWAHASVVLFAGMVFMSRYVRAPVCLLLVCIWVQWSCRTVCVHGFVGRSVFVNVGTCMFGCIYVFTHPTF